MGNKYSVVQDERDEAEFRRLVEAVEVAQQVARIHDDVEAGPWGKGFGDAVYGHEQCLGKFDPLTGAYQRPSQPVQGRRTFLPTCVPSGLSEPIAGPPEASVAPIVIAPQSQPTEPIVVKHAATTNRQSRRSRSPRCKVSSTSRTPSERSALESGPPQVQIRATFLCRRSRSPRCKVSSTSRPPSERSALESGPPQVHIRATFLSSPSPAAVETDLSGVPHSSRRSPERPSGHEFSACRGGRSPSLTSEPSRGRSRSRRWERRESFVASLQSDMCRRRRTPSATASETRSCTADGWIPTADDHQHIHLPSPHEIIPAPPTASPYPSATATLRLLQINEQPIVTVQPPTGRVLHDGISSSIHAGDANLRETVALGRDRSRSRSSDSSRHSHRDHNRSRTRSPIIITVPSTRHHSWLYSPTMTPPGRSRSRSPRQIVICSTACPIRSRSPSMTTAAMSCRAASPAFMTCRRLNHAFDAPDQDDIPSHLPAAQFSLDNRLRHLETLVDDLDAREREHEDLQNARAKVSQSRDECLIRTLEALHKTLARGAFPRRNLATGSRISLTFSSDSNMLSEFRDAKDAEDPKAHPQGNDDQEKTSWVNPYLSIPFAAGLLVQHTSPRKEKWQPAWTVFPLKAFRGASYTFIKIQAEWDDEALLRELRRTYDGLRTFWRKWFWLRSVGSITMVLADHSFIYPQRLGPAKVSPSKNMRLRWLLSHPEAMRGHHEFMEVLTARTDLGIEFVERFQLFRIAVAIIIPVALSLVLGVAYAEITGDVSSAFTVAGYMTSAYSVFLVLIGVLNLVEF